MTRRYGRVERRTPSAALPYKRRVNVRVVALAVAGIAALVGAAGLAAATKTSRAPAANGVSRGGVLTFARSLEPQTLDPHTVTDNGSAFAEMQIYDQLVELMPGKSDPVPGLADRWKIRNGGRIYDFHLRRGVKFSNGSPVTARDVVFSLNRFAFGKGSAASFLVSTVTSIRARNAQTVRITLKRTSPSLLASLATFWASIYPEKVFKQEGAAKFARAPVGSGAFMVKKFVRGEKLELVRNPYYWRAGQPYVAGVTFLFIPDDSARILAVESGRADVAEAVPPSQVSRVENSPGLNVLSATVAASDEVRLNNAEKPLNDVRVRQALNYATPRDGIVKAAYFGNAMPSNNTIPPTKYEDKSIPPIPYNPDKAKQLLAKSSAPHGFALTLNIVGTDAISRQIGAILQSSWQKIGVTVKLNQLDQAAWFDRIGKGNYEAALYINGTADIPVDDEMGTFFYDAGSGTNGAYTNWSSPAATKLIRAATSTLNEAKRRALFRKLQLLGQREVPTVSLVFPPALTAIRENVHGFQTVTNGWWRLEKVYLSK